MKRMIIGIMIGLLIGTAGTALAATSEPVQAVFAKFTFVVNGEEKTLDADPLVYQGGTYLPVRVVANMLGYDVTYKADSRTIELDSIVITTSDKSTQGAENSMSETATMTEWISLRELSTQYDLTVTVGGDQNVLTMLKSDGETFMIDAPILENGQSRTFQLIGRPGEITVTVENYTTFLSFSDLKSLGIID